MSERKAENGPCGPAGSRLPAHLARPRHREPGVFPIAISLPWGIAPAALPQLPLPAKIRTAFQPAVQVDSDPERAEDEDYVASVYREVEERIQSGMDALARRRTLPLFG